MAQLKNIAHALIQRAEAFAEGYHSFVERRIRCHKAQRAFHLVHAGAHASYFGGVAAHAFDFYGPVALALCAMTAIQLFVFDGE